MQRSVAQTHGRRRDASCSNDRYSSATGSASWSLRSHVTQHPFDLFVRHPALGWGPADDGKRRVDEMAGDDHRGFDHQLLAQMTPGDLHALLQAIDPRQRRNVGRHQLVGDRLCLGAAAHRRHDDQRPSSSVGGGVTGLPGRRADCASRRT